MLNFFGNKMDAYAVMLFDMKPVMKWLSNFLKNEWFLIVILVLIFFIIMLFEFWVY